jgi:predicted aspartyl protease
METATMGRVVVTAKIENLDDLYRAHRGEISPQQVRTVEVDDALVDTGATGLGIPLRLIEQLGLIRRQKRRVRTTAGPREVQMYEAAQVTVQDRDCRVDVTEVPADCPVLIGQVPLELLDFVVDPQGRRLIGNPDHGGQHMFDMF